MKNVRAQNAARTPSVALRLQRLEDRCNPAAPIPTIFVDTSGGFVAGNSVGAQIRFDQPVDGFEQSDITVTDATISNFSGSSFANDLYTFTLTPTAFGTATLTVPADSAINASSEGNTTGTFFQSVDSPVKVSLIYVDGANTLTAGNITGGTIFFNSVLTSFDPAGLVATNATLANFTQVDNTLSFTLTPTAYGPVTVSVAQGTGFAGANPNYSAGPATFSAASPVKVDLIYVDGANTLTAGQTTGGTIFFNSVLTSFDPDGLVATNATIANVSHVPGSNALSFTLTPTAAGPVTVSVAEGTGFSGDNPNYSAGPATFTAVNPPSLSLPLGFYATSVGPSVVIHRPGGSQSEPFQPFASLPGGYAEDVSVAMADLNGDAIPELVAGMAPSPAGNQRASFVYVFDGATSQPIALLLPFGFTFGGGVSVAAGAGKVVVGAGPGGGPAVHVYDGPSLYQGNTEPEARFFAFNEGFTGGVRVAAGLNGVGTPIIVAGSGPGVAPLVAQYTMGGALLGSTAFQFSSGSRNGVFVAFDGLHLAVGEGGGGSEVQVFTQSLVGVQSGGNSFTPFGGFGGGARVAFADVNGDGKEDLITAAGPGGGPAVLFFDPSNPSVFAQVASGIFAGDPNNTRGVYVG